jgi:hypothetical protein
MGLDGFISNARPFSLLQHLPESYIQDKKTGTMSARGLFGTRKSGGFWGNLFRTDYKHVGNTNVVHCGDSLYALWEGGKPYLLDPLTLKNKVCIVRCNDSHVFSNNYMNNTMDSISQSLLIFCVQIFKNRMVLVK